MDCHRYADGTEIYYDREAHKLAARVKGEAEIERERTIRAKCMEEAKIHSEKEIILKAP